MSHQVTMVIVRNSPICGVMGPTPSIHGKFFMAYKWGGDPNYLTKWEWS